MYHHIKDGQGNPEGGTKFHEQAKESDAPLPIVRNPQKHQAKESHHVCNI